MTNNPPGSQTADAMVERVAAAIRPNLFRLYPGGRSFMHEQTRKQARAAITALDTREQG